MILFHLLISMLTGTILIESFFAFVFGVRNKKDFLNITLVNLMTNPFLVIFSFMMKAKFGNTTYYIVIMIMEVIAVIAEGYVYEKYLYYRRINPFLFSLILNVLSFSLGLFISYR